MEFKTEEEAMQYCVELEARTGYEHDCFFNGDVWVTFMVEGGNL